MPDPLFRFSTTLEVIWRDLDALGHVNNAVYFSYLEYARMKYLQELGLAFRSLQEVGIILAEAACTYHSPLSLASG
jgi:acyl-CoA thioester hydrolase